ncbi:MAG TPA: hypothetical protein VFE18_17700 [Phenylobacterium sp.]|jgi:hypothetical protein|uniref:hypothetical protein n=1 Tax=Phenylobacterium sp. TaxID=1871053 RepID=UPI002D42F1E2|nr:hypothetical protein [Phenylobacterium sp.]HZZ70010.1 hypothetical protein [Phenylobacterium sp.]
MKLRIALTLAALAVAGSAFAQPPAGGGANASPEMQAARKAMMESCAADMKTLCDGKQGREAMMCMRDNADKTSQGCKDAMAKMRAARQSGGGGR